VNLWVIHRNPDLFSPDSNAFNPERWLDKERAKGMDYYLVHVRYSAPFSADLQEAQLRQLTNITVGSGIQSMPREEPGSL
jgi:cytochrome P450